MDRVELARLLQASVKGMPAAGTRPPGRRPRDREVAASAIPAARMARGRRTEPTVITESDPVRFLAAFAAAAGGIGPVFLADPNWGATERGRLDELTRQPSARRSPTGRGWLGVPSGGSGGTLKFARHDEETIAAAVHGFCAHFRVPQVNAVGVLPLHHVSGLMAWMRCALTGGSYEPWPWRDLAAGHRPAINRNHWFLSLVPTQLQRLLASAESVAWLRKFRAVFVGGGPAWPDLAVAAARAKLPVSFTYGMTETAAMVAALPPGEFLKGIRDCGPPLPHARVIITPEGSVSVSGESVFRGYWPEWREERNFLSADLGQLDKRGHLRILGRNDAMIITGGKKVAPPEIEAALRATGEFTDVAVLGVPDGEWGQAAVAFYPAKGRQPDLRKVRAELSQSVAAHLCPKRYVGVTAWPRNSQGKVNRAVLLAALAGAGPRR
ncbi:MAG: o-succinylbenzoate--CoA ligase [Opitutaceae bacterium]|nr:o-succinylbenzoate--CoA ligase [Opitutaceae bacterium]